VTADTTQEIARLTADAVVFGTRDRDLHVLLIRRRWAPFEGCWALPGGWVDPGEETMAAAHRELSEETGLRVAELRPFAVYGDVGRDPRGRYVTFAYTTRLPHTPTPTAEDDAADAQWLLVDDVLTGKVRLAFDHARIVDDALRLTI
jgi:8-oxo-dGTP diphosphatase